MAENTAVGILEANARQAPGKSTCRRQRGDAAARHTLSRAELCLPSPSMSYVEVLPLESHNVTVFGDKAFKEVIKLE